MLWFLSQRLSAIITPVHCTATIQITNQVRASFLSELELKNASECLRQGDIHTAIRICNDLLALAPENSHALRLLATIQIQTNDFASAVQTLSTLSTHFPSDVSVIFNLGSALAKQNRLDEAISCFRRAVALSPQSADIKWALALALKDAGQLAEAISLFRLVVQLRPDWIVGQIRLGDALCAANRFGEAIEAYAIAARLNPMASEPFLNLSWAYHFAGEYEKALFAAKRAAELSPNLVQSHIYLGNAHYDLGNLAEAIRCYEQALRLDPQSAVAHRNLGKTLLRIGDFGRGWPEYEWRWLADGMPTPAKRFPQPVWDGTSPRGQTILLYGEQGFGDQIQFFRYAHEVQKMGARVIVQSHQRLTRLLRTGFGFDLLIGRNETPPKFDAQASFMSLPGILGTTIDTIPASSNYLSAEPSLVSHWQKILGDKSGIKVGIAWQGNPDYAGDRFRSLNLALFEGIAKSDNVRLISLQVGQGAKQISSCSFRDRIEDYCDQMDTGKDGFVDTAAVIANLDVVLSCDSSIAHLSGALGKNTWILLNRDAEWRWFVDRDDSPWYPSVRLFRQAQLGNWEQVVERVSEALKNPAALSCGSFRFSG